MLTGSKYSTFIGDLAEAASSCCKQRCLLAYVGCYGTLAWTWLAHNDIAGQ